MEKIDLDVTTPKLQKLTDKPTENKMAALDKSMEIFHSKPGEYTEADEDVFENMVAGTLKRMNPYPLQKNYRT